MPRGQFTSKPLVHLLSPDSINKTCCGIGVGTNASLGRRLATTAPDSVTCWSCRRTVTFKYVAATHTMLTPTKEEPMRTEPFVHHLRNAAFTTCGLNVLGDRARDLQAKGRATWDPKLWTGSTTVIRDDVTCPECVGALVQRTLAAEPVGRPTMQGRLHWLMSKDALGTACTESNPGGGWAGTTDAGEVTCPKCRNIIANRPVHLSDPDDSEVPRCGAQYGHGVAVTTHPGKADCPKCRRIMYADNRLEQALNATDRELLDRLAAADTEPHPEKPRRYAPSDQVPLYEHDCAKCQYLGSWEYYDLYACPEGRTVIARYADYGIDPGGYLSGLAHAWHDPALAFALAKALHHKLIRPSDLPSYL
jgi:ssDNA-binding Zn-finger/Zn-ribbon topoisomerase 1